MRTLIAAIAVGTILLASAVAGCGKAGDKSAPQGVRTLTLKLADGMVMAYVPAGKFKMGSPETEKDREDDETQHEVTITKPFYMG